VVAGVLGERRLAYDLWGDAVNVAARMESHGVAGRIQLSAETRRRLPAGFAVVARGPIAIKGRGEMETFFLTGWEGEAAARGPSRA
jgi:class 3 adenylate cyclase